jgi:hypothetical protein
MIITAEAKAGSAKPKRFTLNMSSPMDGRPGSGPGLEEPRLTYDEQNVGRPIWRRAYGDHGGNQYLRRI